MTAIINDPTSIEHDYIKHLSLWLDKIKLKNPIGTCILAIRR